MISADMAFSLFGWVDCDCAGAQTASTPTLQKPESSIARAPRVKPNNLLQTLGSGGSGVLRFLRRLNNMAKSTLPVECTIGDIQETVRI